MIHCNYIANFKDVPIIANQPAPECDFNLTKPGRLEDLKKFIAQYAKQPMPPGFDYDKSHRNYRAMIDAAIKNNHLEAVETLWEGSYYYERTGPNPVEHIYTAAEYGTLITFQHMLDIFLNYYEGKKLYIKLDLLLEKSNLEVYKYVLFLKLVLDVDTLENVQDYILDDFDDEDLEDRIHFTKAQYLYDRLNWIHRQHKIKQDLDLYNKTKASKVIQRWWKDYYYRPNGKHYQLIKLRFQTNYYKL